MAASAAMKAVICLLACLATQAANLPGATTKAPQKAPPPPSLRAIADMLVAFAIFYHIQHAILALFVGLGICKLVDLCRGGRARGSTSRTSRDAKENVGDLHSILAGVDPQLLHDRNISLCKDSQVWHLYDSCESLHMKNKQTRRLCRHCWRDFQNKE